MHMLMVIFGGIALFGVFLLFAHLWGDTTLEFGLAAKAFLPVWFAVSIANLLVGVHKAGYTVVQELPILVVVFAVPAIIAGLTIWQFARH